MQTLLEKAYIDSDELEKLLNARKAGEIDFLLIDVREEMEYEDAHIDGVDHLKPTSVFQQWAEALLNETKERHVVFTCRTGSRSGQVQQVFAQNGHCKTLNHIGGILSYRGNVVG